MTVYNLPEPMYFMPAVLLTDVVAAVHRAADCHQQSSAQGWRTATVWSATLPAVSVL